MIVIMGCRIIKNLVLIATVLLVIVSCGEKESFEKSDDQNVTVSFNEIGVKTTFDDSRSHLLWKDGDEIAIYNDYNDSKVIVSYATGESYDIQVPIEATTLTAIYPQESIQLVQEQEFAGVFNGYNYPVTANAPIFEGKCNLYFQAVGCALALNVFDSKEGGAELEDISIQIPLLSAKYSVHLNNPYVISNVSPGNSKRLYSGQVYITIPKGIYNNIEFTIRTSSNTYKVTTNNNKIDCQSYDFVVLNLDLSKYEIDGPINGLSLEEWQRDYEPLPYDGKLFPSMDGLDHDIIPDFSRVGYKYGDSEIPVLPIRKTLTPTGDNTDRTAEIQAAIDEVSLLGGGTVFMSAGEYYSSETIFIDSDGVVLKGETGTKIIATGKKQRAAIFLGNSVVSSGKRVIVSENVSGILSESIQIAEPEYEVTPSLAGSMSSQYAITESYTPVGRMYVTVAAPSKYYVGERVVIYRPSTENWIHSIHMDEIAQNESGTVNQWTVNSKAYRLKWERTIMAISGNRVYLDNPVVMSLDNDVNYSRGYLFGVSLNRIKGSGVENLEIESTFDNSKTAQQSGETYYSDEEHAWTAIQVNNAEHCWITDIVTRHFGYSSVLLSNGAKNITVDGCRSLSPVSSIDGSRRYAFCISGGTMCLIKNCFCEHDRHQFVESGLECGPNVFTHCSSTTSYSDCGPHQRWCTGGLYDCVTVDNRFGVSDGAGSGTGHGWRGAYEVMWNPEIDGSRPTTDKTAFLYCQSPWASAVNYCIGAVGPKKAAMRPYDDNLGQRIDGIWFPAVPVDGVGTTHISLPYNHSGLIPDWWPEFENHSFSDPFSLYQCQLEDRHARGIFLSSIF